MMMEQKKIAQKYDKCFILARNYLQRVVYN